MRKLSGLITFLVILSASSPAYAVDADLYSLDDFIDPRILGYDFEDESGDDFSRGSTLVLANARVGSAINYQQREIFTDSDAGFGQFDISWYYNALQWGYRYHRFSSDFDESISQKRHKVFFGIYALHDDDLPVSRYLLTLEQDDFDNKHADELGIDLDLSLHDSYLFNWTENFYSGMSFRYRDQEGENETRVLIRFSKYDFIYERVTFRASFGAAEVDDEWDWAITKLAISAYHPIPPDRFKLELHAYYAFTYRPERGDTDNESNNEIGVFVNIPLFLN